MKKVRRKQKKTFKTFLIKGRVITSEVESKKLYEKSCFGEIVENRIEYSLIEALYLLEKNKIVVYSGKKPITFEGFLRKASKLDPNFYTKFIVYRDMRDRGYIVKTALKFGADFRVYAKGIKPGEDHAKWILYPVHESSILTWQEFAAKNRVAHSTRKNLLIGIVDDEGDVTYYEVSWKKP